LIWNSTASATVVPADRRCQHLSTKRERADVAIVISITTDSRDNCSGQDTTWPVFDGVHRCINGKQSLFADADGFPSLLCGKVLATAVSRYYSGRAVEFQYQAVDVHSSVRKTERRENWSKLDQCRYLATEFDMAAV